MNMPEVEVCSITSIHVYKYIYICIVCIHICYRRLPSTGHLCADDKSEENFPAGL